jgi:hypothetical protein
VLRLSDYANHLFGESIRQARKRLNEEYLALLSSREVSKNTTRAMRESAKQGFWNGATPPLGYKIVEVAE